MMKKLRGKILTIVLCLAAALWPMTAHADVVMGPPINAGNVMMVCFVVPVVLVVIITLIILKNTKEKDDGEKENR